jgi:zinc protease
MHDVKTQKRHAETASQASGHTIVPVRAAAFGPALWATSFRLENGLTIVLAPDHRAPIFAYQTWFRVGSKHEDPNLTGVAHLFEHLMFKGTTRYATGVFDREMGRRGAQTNAATWVDWTYYTQALAARGDNLETVIAFESDRMVNLVIDEATFRSELEVVKNERRMAVEDAVGGALSEALMALAFDEHPYRWPTIGSMAHLEAATVNDLRAFYRSYYAPNNATVVLVGDLDPVQTLVALARAYGPLQPQPVDHGHRVPDATQQEARAQTIRRPVLTPQVVMGFRAPPQGTPEHDALEMLTDVLTEGDTGRLHHRLVTTDRLASDISGYLTPFAEHGLFELHMNVAPDTDPARAVAVVHEELARIAEGITAQELDKARNGLTLGLYDSLKDVEGMAEALGHAQTNTDDFSQAFAAPAAYAACGEAELRQVAATYLQPHHASVVTAMPSEEQP